MSHVLSAVATVVIIGVTTWLSTTMGNIVFLAAITAAILPIVLLM